jgi:xylose isomerase
MDGVWKSAAANIRMYLLLKSRAAAFRADPEVQTALAESQVAELSATTLSAGETATSILGDAAIANFDVDAAGAKGYGFVRLQQLAVEHIMGVR